MKKMEAGDCDFPGHPPARDNTLVCVNVFVIVCLRSSTLGKISSVNPFVSLPPCTSEADTAGKQQSRLLRLLLRVPTVGERSSAGGVVKGHLHQNGPGSVTPAEKVKRVPVAFWF